jgi:hypothetical protein
VYELFRESPVPDVRLGKDDWWFLTSTIEAKPCAEDAEPQPLIDGYQKFITAARAAGKTPLVVHSPDKAEMYPEYLSDRDRERYEACAEPRRARLEYHFETNWGFLDLWKPLREEKARLLALPPEALDWEHLRFLFRPADRHWHFETGRIQAREIVNALAPGRFETMPQPEFPTKYVAMRSELSKRFLQFAVFEPFSMLGAYPDTLVRDPDDRLGPDHRIRHYSVADERADPRRLLVIHDSFIYPSYPFIASSFARTTFVHWGTVQKHRKKAKELLREADVIVLQSVDSGRGEHAGGILRVAKLLGEIRASDGEERPRKVGRRASKAVDPAD